MAMFRVHLEFGFVVSAPEAESHKPGMKQARVVRVLDVLLHQLPVSGNTLAVIAQDFQLATIKQAVEVSQDDGAEKVFERFDRMVEAGEYDATARRDLELVQAVVAGLEVRRHTAVDLAV